MSSTASPVLPQGAGYGVVLGIGLFFSALMLGLTALQKRYTAYSPSNSEEFSSASRSIKPGLIASGIVSAWTWAATLLQSSAVTYKYGISGPWWYGAGAMVQILLFAQLAAKLKLNAPNAHTWLEIVGERWGTVAHCVFLFFGLATNIIVSSMLILGGSATVTDLTGMNTIAAIFLIPLGVAIYVIAGGMRATLLCDYTHTTVLLTIVLVFTLAVYATSPKIGSIRTMHALLTTASRITPVPGNKDGSYLTMRSKNGLIFGVINLVGNFATVFNDQAYWQRAIASRPATCVKAYLLGGLAWFAIPFTFSMTLGLAAVALRTLGDPAMRTLTPADVSAGLPAPSAAAALFGQPGAAAMLVLLFLAVTSATSAELIAVSSILTYDVYKRYINPLASKKQVLRVSHYMVAAYALVMSLAGLIFFYIGVSMGWLYTFMGVVLGSSVVPIALCTTWQKANKTGCIAGAVIGFIAGLVAWLGTTAGLNAGVINVVTTGGDLEMMAGNVASICLGAIVALVWSYLSPDNFDFSATRALNAPHQSHHNPPKDPQTNYEIEASPDVDDKEKYISADVSSITTSSNPDLGLSSDADLDPILLTKSFKFALYSSVALLIITLILVPLPLFFAQTVYGVRGFGAWVGIGIAWAFMSCGVVVVFPVWEAREGVWGVAKGLWEDLVGRRSARTGGVWEERRSEVV